MKKELNKDNLEEVTGGAAAKILRVNKVTLFVCRNAGCGNEAYVSGSLLHTTRVCPKCGMISFYGERVVNEEDVPCDKTNGFF